MRTTQLMTHKIQMMASNCVGHVVVQPLKTKANHSPRLFMILRTV